jgi:hypothetical protein
LILIEIKKFVTIYITILGYLKNDSELQLIIYNNCYWRNLIYFFNRYIFMIGKNEWIKKLKDKKEINSISKKTLKFKYKFINN